MLPDLPETNLYSIGLCCKRSSVSSDSKADSNFSGARHPPLGPNGILETDWQVALQSRSTPVDVPEHQRVIDDRPRMAPFKPYHGQLPFSLGPGTASKAHTHSSGSSAGFADRQVHHADEPDSLHQCCDTIVRMECASLNLDEWFSCTAVTFSLAGSVKMVMHGDAGDASLLGMLADKMR